MQLQLFRDIVKFMSDKRVPRTTQLVLHEDRPVMVRAIDLRVGSVIIWDTMYAVVFSVGDPFDRQVTLSLEVFSKVNGEARFHGGISRHTFIPKHKQFAVVGERRPL